MVAKAAPGKTLLKNNFWLGTIQYNATKTTNIISGVIVHLKLFHSFIKLSSKPKYENRIDPICCPNTGNISAMMNNTIINNVKTTDNPLTIKKGLVSSISYELFNDFTIAFIPLEADQIVPIIPIDKSPPFRLSKISDKVPQ